MDAAKAQRLKAELAAQGDTPFVQIERFFDGNDDDASIGCNLLEHPGIHAFREALVGLTRRPDVEAVYALISEIDPGKDYWPFTDTIVVIGKMSAEDLEAALGHLEPDELGPAEEFHLPKAITDRHVSPVSVAWWD